MRQIKIFLIAGEKSGDKLGAYLIKALKKQYEGRIIFHGIAGEEMSENGLKSIFPIQQISLMGFMEILPHIFRLFKLINLTTTEIEKFQPDVIVTIDSPGFNFRIAQKINRRFKMVHYVAPSVWAYKPKRAQFMKKYYNLVLALLPFEPPFFIKIGLPCEFVGHPIIENNWAGTKETVFRQKYNINKNAVVFGVMCGSRAGEIKQMLPIFSETIKLFIQQTKESFKDKELIWVFPAVSKELAEQIHTNITGLGIKFFIPVNEPDKVDMFKSMDFAIVKSGTSSLEMALAGVPMVVAYKVNIFTAWILRYFYKLNTYVSIVNILAKKEVIPELLQENCTAEKLTNALINLVRNQGKKQVIECKKLLKQLKPQGKILPSVQAAKAVLGLLKK